MNSQTPVAEGFSVRARRFLRKPLREKVNVLRTRASRTWRSLRPVRLRLGFWWVPGDNNLTEPLLAGKFESSEMLFAQCFLRAGMTVLDVGAHHGLYSLLASRRVGRSGTVYAFEPSARERRVLRMHLILNRCSNVTVEKCALGSENGAKEFFVVQGNQTGCNSLRPPVVSSATAEVWVDVTRLDDWIAQKKIGRVDFIKLDVEGGELAVLEGAVKLLGCRPRPVILAEVQDVRTKVWGYRAKDILLRLRNHGYQWFELSEDGSLYDLDLSRNEFDGNFVAYPEEAVAGIERLRFSESSAPAEINREAINLHNGTKDWTSPYEVLRGKWGEVPTTRHGRMKTSDLLALSDDELLGQWEKSRIDITTGAEFAHRGWYHALYADAMRGKKVMDVGSGFGVDSITFAQHGARLTFVDLVETNLNVLRRLCKILGINDVRFHLMRDVDSLRTLDNDYDVIMAMGSLHHMPGQAIKSEYQELVRHLKVGGRWLQLAYPTQRWIRDGKPSFGRWGEMTDGPGTPWSEPYDVPKLLRMLAPAKFDVVLYQEIHDSDFNWFDLLYRGQ
jgi:FkbM family methyltransferase